MNVEKLISDLSEMESRLNRPMGISCLRAVILYLKRGDIESAKAIADLDFDKMRQYPELAEYVKKSGLLITRRE